MQEVGVYHPYAPAKNILTKWLATKKRKEQKNSAGGNKKMRWTTEYLQMDMDRLTLLYKIGKKQRFFKQNGYSRGNSNTQQIYELGGGIGWCKKDACEVLKQWWLWNRLWRKSIGDK